MKTSTLIIRKKNVFIILTIIVILLAIFPGRSISQPMAEGHEKFLGNIYGNTVGLNFESYWNQVTPENAGKWGTAEGSRDQYNWTTLDQIYDYAMQRNILFKMHNLVSPSQQPAWINNLSAEEQKEEVEEWIKLVGEKYPDADLVDVVSEPMALTDDAYPKYYEALGGKGTTGWDWVIWTFEKARQYLPKSKLLVNESGVLIGTKSIENFLVLINLLKDRNLIDGIGLVGHDLENIDTTTLHNRLNQLASAGLPLYISSLDIVVKDDTQQLEEFKELFPLLWNHPAVMGITFWGYVQGSIYHGDGWLVKPDGTERASLDWLRQFLTQPGTYRSFQSGNWNDNYSWEEYNGTEWQHPVTAIPAYHNQQIRIQQGHTITATESDSVDQLIIAAGGSTIINEGVDLIVKNGEGIDMTVYGTVENYGTLTVNDSTELKFLNGGTYKHLQDGGTIPTAIWGTGSFCKIEGVVSKAPSNANQDFYEIHWNCSNQAGNYNLGWNGNTIEGGILISNTGTGRLYMCAPPANSSASVTINGNVVLSGGTFSTNGTGNAGTSVTINHYGDIIVGAGNFSISRGSQGGNGTAGWNFYGTSFSISNATTQNSNSAGGKFVFKGNVGKQSLTLDNVNFGSGGLPIEVDSGAVISLGMTGLRGNGKFILKDGASLEIINPSGIDSSIVNTGERFLSKAANYIFNGSLGQITGSLLPDTVTSLILDNLSNSLTLSHDVVVNGNLEMKSGSLLLGENKLLYGMNSSLKYSGTSAQTTADAEFPSSGGPANLIVTNTKGVSLHASRKISGTLELAGKLKLGNYDLTASSANSTGLTRYAITDGTGSLKLPAGNSETLFPLGTATSYAPVWITNNGTLDTVGVQLVGDTSPAAEGGRVNVKWHLDESVNGGGNYSLKFGWVTLIENSDFRKDRITNARVFNLDDTTEAGSGEYTTQFSIQPYTTMRGGIETLGWFGVGLFGKITDIKEDVKDIPAEFYLSQNYPNPFNPSTEINYQLSENSNVTLTVYDVLGKEIVKLVDEYQNAGKYKLVFNGQQTTGNKQLTSGIYFYMLKANNRILTKKMMLLK